MTAASSEVPLFVPNPFRSPTRILSYAQLKFINEEYGILTEDVGRAGWTSTDASDTLVMPVFSPTKEVRGHIARTKLNDGSKRVKSYKVKDAPWQSWYVSSINPSNILVLVEDQISAVRMAAKLNTVALLGTVLSLDKVNEIVTEFTSKREDSFVIMCLDKDATTKAIQYRKHYGLALRNFIPIFLSKDIKDMQFVEFTDLVKEIKTTTTDDRTTP